MDWTVQKDSNIRRLPKLLWPGAVIARNARQLFKKAPYAADGVTSLHIMDFRSEPRFVQAYSRAVKAGGWDYGIPLRIHQALWCSRVAQRVSGDFVELGTGRGFVMSALLEAGLTRSVHLFDSFQSNYLADDGSQTGDEASPYYATSFEAVQANFAEWPQVHFHCGDVYDTLPAARLTQVAFVHVDMNHPNPEEFGVRTLWPLIPSGGVILFDDYAFLGCERQHERCDRLAAELGFDILTTASGQGIVIKP